MESDWASVSFSQLMDTECLTDSAVIDCVSLSGGGSQGSLSWGGGVSEREGGGEGVRQGRSNV